MRYVFGEEGSGTMLRCHSKLRFFMFDHSFDSLAKSQMPMVKWTMVKTSTLFNIDLRLPAHLSAIPEKWDTWDASRKLTRK